MTGLEYMQKIAEGNKSNWKKWVGGGVALGAAALGGLAFHGRKNILKRALPKLEEGVERGIITPKQFEKFKAHPTSHIVGYNSLYGGVLGGAAGGAGYGLSKLLGKNKNQ